MSDPNKKECSYSEKPNSSDTISRQAAIDEIGEWIKAFLENGHKESAADARLIQDGIIQLPSAQPVDKDINVPTNDYISRQAAIDAINEIINRFERILQGIRESKVDDSVCGMCEYDGAYIGQSGDWCNECPGFEKNNCFKLSDKCRTRWLKSVELPSAQPKKKKGKWIEFDSSEDKYDVIKCPCCKHTFTVDSYHWTDIGFIKDDFKFCPNCGADMRKARWNG